MPLGGLRWDPLYLAIAVALSSTVIIVKVLYEKRELDTLPGRITLGVLVLQDLFAILFLAVQPNLDDLRSAFSSFRSARVIVLVGAALLVSRFVLPWIFHRIARSPELVLVGALAWCFLVGEVGERLDLSREMGALVAGVAISTFPYALDVTAKVTTLRDFFITLFFVALGMTIPLPTASIIGLALLIVRLPSGQPDPDGVLSALSDAARTAREPSARHQPVADERVLAGADPGRRRCRSDQRRMAASAASLGFRHAGGAEHLRHDRRAIPSRAR